MTSLTNIIATIAVVLSTNTFAPKQYRYYIAYPEGGGMETWSDTVQHGGTDWYAQMPWSAPQQTRDNPDVRITEVREIKTLSFEYEGKTWTAEISNVLLSTSRKKRVVKTDERWVDE